MDTDSSKAIVTDPAILADMPTLLQGQAHDLKVSAPDYRVWLSRCGPDDGETHRVHVEVCNHGRWVTLCLLHPFATS